MNLCQELTLISDCYLDFADCNNVIFAMVIATQAKARKEKQALKQDSSSIKDLMQFVLDLTEK